MVGSEKYIWQHDDPEWVFFYVAVFSVIAGVLRCDVVVFGIVEFEMREAVFCVVVVGFR